MGHVTKLPVREEKKAIDGGVERLLLRTELDRRGKWNYLEQRRDVRSYELPPKTTSFRQLGSNLLADDLSDLSDHKLEIIRKKMDDIAARPLQIGEIKSGRLSGFRTVKFDDQSYVLLYKVDERNKAVRFFRYGHHKHIYAPVPVESQLTFAPLEQLLRR